MGKTTLYQKFKRFVSNLGWKLFIWGNELTENQYWKQIYEQEKNFRERNSML